jgi:hypothetical protein
MSRKTSEKGGKKSSLFEAKLVLTISAFITPVFPA